ncbi:hypothetical protein [Bifidobacterium boum]|uniref:hypothetical protein n=1 Tax=Bifidobacterium boum TaxID=78343 RepID=UPI0024321F0B|nr:hypothetical protein [Bifidobacterium boum]MCI5861963.1 hypothetical protein [Bifidobacterium boum]
MTDTTTTADSEASPVTGSPVVDGVLDLRPPVESVKRELCRIGLEWSSTDADGTESWRDYQRGLLATFPPDGGQATLTDIKTNISQSLTLAQLKQVTRVDTMTAAD